MRKHTLTLKCSQDDARLRLKMQMSPYALGGWVENTRFKIYKHLHGVFVGKNIRKLLYCFYGEYHPSGKHTQLIYQVRPGLFIWFIYSLLSLLILYKIHQVIVFDEPIDVVIILLCFLLIFHLIIYLQKKTCIADFEDQLTAEVRNKK